MIKLHKHQHEAVDFMLTAKKSILADKCGVGKTFPAIVFARFCEGKRLVVCPAYLIANWEEEIKKIFPGAEVSRLDSKAKDKEAVITSDYDFLITSYGMLRQMVKQVKNNRSFTFPKLKSLFKIRWGCVVYDEAHRLRNQGSNTSKNARRLKTEHCAILTATPIIKNFGDLFSPLKLCDPQTYSSYWRFVEEHCRTTKTPFDTQIGKLKNKEESYRSISDRVMMRSPDDCDIPWPEYSITKVIVEPSSKLYKAYRYCKKNYVAEIGDKRVDCLASADLIANMRKMLINPPGKQNPKLQAIKDIVKDAPGKVLIYSWYKDNAKKVAQELKCLLITGDTPMREREATVRDWKGKAKVLSATLKSVNEGNNWQHCDTIIFLDAHWTMADNEQGIGRCVRFGQKNTVRVFVVCVKGTLDTRIWRLANERGNVNEELLILQELKEE